MKTITIPDAVGTPQEYTLIDVRPLPWQRRVWELARVDGSEVYQVYQTTVGAWACTCPAWRYSDRQAPPKCKHREAIQRMLDEETASC